MDAFVDRVKRVAKAARERSNKGKDSKYFSSTKKGEIPELKAELHSSERSVTKDAVKKVIAAVTVGKDMSDLFPDVIGCIQTDDIEMKKLVYLYLINYAKTNPDMAIMAVNTFVRDAKHPSPLIRALAVRTMGCIRVERITEYLSKPLQMGLADEDPYVRKTAAIGVAKLYDISPSMARDQGFIEKLRDLLSDGNPTVVANAVAALSEIQDASARDVFDITSAVLQKLLAALNECTEWGQVFILDALARYEPSDEREAESVIDRVVPRLAHQNSAVVLSAVKIVMKFLEYVTTQESITQFSRKLAPPLVTLAQAQQPEIQYVALRNINLVVQKRPALLARNIKVFFCKYNDPIYVKMEKLDILVRLATERNIDQVLLELKEYASEVDVDFVRKATRTIGRCAIKLEGAAERCIKVLLQLIRTKVNYVVQEAVVVIKDIFRRYPNRYESVISVLCDALDDLDEPEAKASMIWIIGEYADRIENAGELLESFLDGFAEEPAAVQLQLLTATVKLFLHKPDSADEVVQRVLRLATEESDNPDLRDRGYIYWRLLSEDPDAASAVVLAQKPVISDTTDYLDEDLLQLLIGQISTLASVYHKPPEAFVARARGAGEGLSDSESSSSDDEGSDGGSDGSSSDDDSEGGAAGADPAGGGMLDTGVDDLLGFGIGGDSGAAPAPAPAPAATVYDTTSGGGGGGGGLDDLFGGSDEPQAAAAPVKPAPRDPLGEKGGISLRGGLVRRDGQTVLDLEIHNGGGSAMHQCALKFNFNAFGLVPVAAAFALPSPVPPGSTGNALVPLQFADSQVKPSGPVQPFFEAALRDNASGTVVFFKCPVPYDALLKQNAHVSKSDFLALWKALPEENESSVVARDLPSSDVDDLMAKVTTAGGLEVTRRPRGDDQVVAYTAFQTINNLTVLAELTFKFGFPVCKVCCKTENVEHCKLVAEAVGKLLRE